FYKLCKQGHWFSFENTTGGRAKKCFKEVTSSLKGWKKKFFLIDRRAILDAMPWRHIDIEVRDDFSISYNEGDADRLAEHVILLRKPPQALLYMCGLTMDYRHPELSQIIKDPEGQVINMDDLLKLHDWNGTLVSKGEPIPDRYRPLVCISASLSAGSVIPNKNASQKNMEKHVPKIAEAREKKEKHALTKANAKRAWEVSSTTPKKKKACKNTGPVGSESEGTICYMSCSHYSIIRKL
ncbi:hypothetical protein Tco_1454986, partial [Tanacetum coccineum]